jgi:16S rRNA (cytidine1402-2'-O)-methyltransferase
MVATPIGNLTDLSHRAIETFRNVDLIAAEDTRRTLKLLSHLGIRKPMLRCDEAREDRAAAEIVERLKDGQSVAFASDAGTPALSDPGSRLVEKVTTSGFKIVPVAGPSAIATALSACGFRAVPFLFLGFLPRKSGQRGRLFQSLSKRNLAVVFFESPFRIQRTMQEVAAAMPFRRVFVARELTKLHEELFRGGADEVSRAIASKKPKGEYTVVLAPLGKKSKIEEE